MRFHKLETVATVREPRAFEFQVNDMVGVHGRCHVITCDSRSNLDGLMVFATVVSAWRYHKTANPFKLIPLAWETIIVRRCCKVKGRGRGNKEKGFEGCKNRRKLGLPCFLCN